MASLVNKQSTRVDYSQLLDAALTNTVVSDAFGKSGTLYMIFIDNKDGSATANFLKLYDTKEVVTEGTSLPTHVIPIGDNVMELYHFPEGIKFSQGLAYVSSQTGGTAAGSAPGATMTMQMVFK